MPSALGATAATATAPAVLGPLGLSAETLGTIGGVTGGGLGHILGNALSPPQNRSPAGIGMGAGLALSPNSMKLFGGNPSETLLTSLLKKTGLSNADTTDIADKVPGLSPAQEYLWNKRVADMMAMKFPSYSSIYSGIR